MTHTRRAHNAVRHLAAHLMAMRLARRLTQREAAALAGLPQSALSRLERAESSPYLDTVLALAAAYDCDLILVPRDTTDLEEPPMTALTIQTTRPGCCECDPTRCRPGQADDGQEYCETTGCPVCLMGCPAPAGQPCCLDGAATTHTDQTARADR